MSTSELKSNLHQLIDGITDNSVLQAVHTLLSKASTSNDKDWYESLSDDHKASIQKGLDDANEGNFVPYEQVQAKADKLLGRP
ncbi:MAG: putative transcriptional regulator [Crocinitomicaceae bacterium]|jgi:predicted transcriptional regulator